MKKIVVSVLLILIALLVVSCRSIGEITDQTFERIYDRYSDRLILDGATSYTVESGDSLSRISYAKYGEPFYYPLIMLASREIVLDPDRIQPGMVLTIPDLQANIERARPVVRGTLNDFVPIERARRGDVPASRMQELADRYR